MIKNIKMSSILLCLSLIISLGICSQSIDFSYYHTTDMLSQNIFYETQQQMNEEIHNLASTCNGYTINLANNESDIYEVDMKSTIEGNNNPIKAFVIFGEHPREMISPETGLNFIKALCNESPLGDYDLSNTIRENYHIKLVLNSNPKARKLVENGDYCRRQNLNKVDINRNWGSHWAFSENLEEQTSSGSGPFSELETKTLKDIATEFNPNVFISIHSGTLGLYTPYAYSDQKAERNEKQMMNIVSDINQKYCKDCGIGAAGKEVGYLCPGTCLDYIYENLNADFSFAFEIYSNNFDIRQSLAQQTFAQITSRNLRTRLDKQKKSVSHNQKQSQPSCFLQSSSENTRKVYDSDMIMDDYSTCFTYFNPVNRDDYEYVVDNWTKAILETLSHVKQIKKGQ